MPSSGGFCLSTRKLALFYVACTLFTWCMDSRGLGFLGEWEIAHWSIFLALILRPSLISSGRPSNQERFGSLITRPAARDGGDTTDKAGPPAKHLGVSPLSSIGGNQFLYQLIVRKWTPGCLSFPQLPHELFSDRIPILARSEER